MKIFDTAKKNKAFLITIVTIVVILLASTIAAVIYGVYRLTNNIDTPPDYPSPVIGTDATANAYLNAAKVGLTRTVCIKGRSKGVVDSKTYWSGFLISDDGYIVTSYSRSQRGAGFTFINFTDFVITVLDNEGEKKTYIANATEYYNEITDILILKIKDIPIGLKFDYFEIDDSSTVQFGDPVLIMGDAINIGLLAHSATIGNPSIIYKDSSSNNDYMSTAVMLINGAVNTGSKGSPLINGDGKVVGMILSKYILGSGMLPNDTIMDTGFAAKADDIISLISKIEVNQ